MNLRGEKEGEKEGGKKGKEGRTNLRWRETVSRRAQADVVVYQYLL